MDADHKSCSRAEKDTSKRPVLTINPERPGSDLAAAAAAALAACSLALAPTDPARAGEALYRARDAYKFAITHVGLYSDSLDECKRTYKSDNWQQYAMFAAAWLFAATGEEQYQSDVVRWQDASEDKSHRPTYAWASVYFGACVLMLSLTGLERWALRSAAMFMQVQVNLDRPFLYNP